MKTPLERAAQNIANETAFRINHEADWLRKDPQYPEYIAQGLLEEVIKCLEEKV